MHWRSVWLVGAVLGWVLCPIAYGAYAQRKDKTVRFSMLIALLFASLAWPLFALGWGLGLGLIVLITVGKILAILWRRLITKGPP